jgi:hypothetical protein
MTPPIFGGNHPAEEGRPSPVALTVRLLTEADLLQLVSH